MRVNTRATAVTEAFTYINRGLTTRFAANINEVKAATVLLEARKPKPRGWPVMAVRCVTNIETDGEGNRMVDAHLTPGGVYQAAVMRLRGNGLRLWVRNDAGQLSLCRFSEFQPINAARRSLFAWSA
jgi:hypothetical protein